MPEVLDVEREAIKRLLVMARRSYDETMAQVNVSKSSYVLAYWDGYIRALETVLDMQYE